jgi:lysophospholipase L1-like esterase
MRCDSGLPLDMIPWRKSSLALNLLLAVVSGAGFVILLEFGARALGVRTPLYLGPAQFNCLQRSSLFGIEFRPGCAGSLFDTPVQTNAVALRGPELRDDGSTRILAIGDSCTWGWKVKQNESYPAQLQVLLDQQAGPGGYQVLNAGMPGTTSYHGLVYLRERGLALQPAIVIAAYGFNDMTTDGDIESELRRASVSAPILAVDDYLLQRSTIWRGVRLGLFHHERRLDQPPRVSADKYRRNFMEMIELVRRHGAQLVLVDLTHKVPDQAYPQALEDLSREFSVPLVVYDGPRVDVVHPTVPGYGILARQLLVVMREQHYLPAALPGAGT